MCFSAAASFTAGVLLFAGGVITVKSVPISSQKYFAAIPFIFSIQQFTEGFVWLSFTNTYFYQWQMPATYLFLFFAQVFWPIWVPLSLIQIEPEKNTKKHLYPFLFIGILVSAYLAFSLVNYNIAPEIKGYHMYYNIHFPLHPPFFSGLAYLIPTVVATMFSKTKGIWLFGLLNLMAYLVSKMYFNDYVLSVWCFFAAWISVIVYLILNNLNNKPLLVIRHKEIPSSPNTPF